MEGIMNWKEDYKYIGTRRESEKVQVTFFSLVELPEIVSIATGCGCSKGKYNKKTKELTVTYTPKKIPQHVRSRGFQHVISYITIMYENGMVDSLSFKAKIII